MVGLNSLGRDPKLPCKAGKLPFLASRQCSTSQPKTKVTGASSEITQGEYGAYPVVVRGVLGGLTSRPSRLALVASRPPVLATGLLFKLQIAREVIQNAPNSYKGLQSHQMKQITRNQVKCNLNANKLGFNESTGT